METAGGSFEVEDGSEGGVHGGGVIVIGRRKYAVGLSWQISPSGRINQAAREAARDSRIPMDFFSVRAGSKTGRIGQFGLSVKDYGHKSGMPSAAVSLATDQPGAWAGAFRVPEGVWVCICRDDLITPDGDFLYKNEAQAKERVIAEINLGQLQQIYAPEEWNLPNSDSIPLPLLIKNRAAGHLRPVKVNVTQIAALVAIVLFVGLAWYVFSSQQQESGRLEHLNLPQEQAAIQQLRRQNVIPNSKLLPTASAPQAVRRLWEDAPTPQRFFQGCRDAFEQIPAVVVGWRRSDVTCASTGVSVLWQRVPGPGDIPPNASGVHGSDTGATSAYSLPGMERRGSEQLMDSADIAKLVINNNWPVKLSKMPDEPLPPQPDGTPTPPPPWIKEKITISGDTAPWETQEQFQGVPGLIIKSIRWLGKSWTTEGVIYENRK